MAGTGFKRGKEPWAENLFSSKQWHSQGETLHNSFPSWSFVPYLLKRVFKTSSNVKILRGDMA